MLQLPALRQGGKDSQSRKIVDAGAEGTDVGGLTWSAENPPPSSEASGNGSGTALGDARGGACACLVTRGRAAAPLLPSCCGCGGCPGRALARPCPPGATRCEGPACISFRSCGEALPDEFDVVSTHTARGGNRL